MPRYTSPAKATVSLSVGWGWIESATSRIVQPISIATTASAISSPAPAADDAATQHAVGRRIEDPLGEPVGAADGDRPAARLPRILGDGDLAAGPLGFVGREAGPGDLRIGEHDGRNRLRLERGRLAGEHFGRHLAFVRRLVGEHRLARHVADRQDVRIGRLLPLVDDDEALVR